MKKKPPVFFKIKEMRESGDTFQKIGDAVNLSRQRINQICQLHEIEPLKFYTVVDQYAKQRKKLQENVKINENTGCMEWQGFIDKTKYGRISIDGASRYTHRVSYRLFKGEVPEDLCVCHSCDNPTCVNPDHLWLGTHLENMQDRDKKGRGRK